MKKEISYIELCQMVEEGEQPQTVTMKANGRRRERLYTWSDVCKSYATNDGVFIGDTGFEYLCKKARFEYEVQVLDDIERRYLKDVLRPFRKDKWLKVMKQPLGDYERITIMTELAIPANLPIFEKGSMYKGMKPNRIYYPEDLGL